jgi:hypothetical protein
MVLVSGTGFPMVIVVEAPVMIPLFEEFPYLETFGRTHEQGLFR